MPLLLRPNPVARRALVWRGSVRDTNAASRALTPVAATRHLFRDHSNGDQHGSRGHHESQHHHHHQAGQLHHRNPIYSQASGLSSDWASLYLGAKLALWSGLCYFPYDTIPRTLQEEGLKLVAYGRTSFTCWYVADGCVNFEALPRRALPRLPLAYTPGAAARSSTTAGDAATPGNDHVDMHGTPDSDSGGGSDNQLDGSKRTDREDRFATTPAAEARTAATTDAWRTINDDYPPDQPPPPPPPPPPPQQCTPAEGGSSTYEAGSAELQSSRIGGSTWAGHADDGRSSGHDTGSLQGHAHAASTPGKGQSSHAFDQGHSLRGGHIHLHRDSPPFHLRVQGAAAGPAGSGGGGGAHAEAMDQASPLAAPRHEPGTGPGLTSAVSAGTRCRFIFLRGVQWAAHDMNTLSLSASLAAFWPEPLLSPGGAAAEPATGREVSTGAGSASLSSSSSPAPSPSTPSSEQLVAHSGVAAMAREVLSVILPHIREATAAGVDHLVFAGHSLGGALAKLLWAMSILQGHRSPAATSCHTFGSPPVLAHAAGGGGARVLRVLRAPPTAAVNWVLEHDPVPRAMLTADPYFSAARRVVPGLSALLALRGAVLGEGAALSSGRFLYETVGELLLLRWSSKGGCEVVPVSEAEAESLLQMALDEAITAPVRSLQYWLDHHHASYHHDLETAALAAYRKRIRIHRSTMAGQQQQRE